MIERKFGDAKRAESVGFSHSDFDFIVKTDRSPFSVTLSELVSGSYRASQIAASRDLTCELVGRPFS